MIGQINIETTSFCNSECVICPHSTMKRKQGHMADALWRKILADCGDQVHHIHYHLNGEPLLNLDLPKIIAFGRQMNPHAEHCFYTNGALLGKRAPDILNTSAVPDKIMISFDGGTKESYEYHRKGLVFEDVIASIREFMKIKEQIKNTKPVVHPLMVVTKENEPTIPQFKELFRQMGIPEKNFIFSGPMNWAGAVSVHPSTALKWDPPCPFLFNNHLFILHTGEAVLCCMDYEGTEIMGDTKTESVHDICYGQKYQYVRGFYINKQWDQLSLCKNCSFGVAPMPDPELQKKVDSVYPQNHCYDIDTLEGNNEGTVERAQQIVSYIKDKITGKIILDIGCNKGLFSLWCALNGAKEVIAQDINPEYIGILHDVMVYKIRNSDLSKNIGDLKYKQLSHRIRLTTEPIGAYYHEGDLALILGAAHYLTYEYGLDWIYRLYIMGYDIFVELPLSAEDPVVKAHEEAGTATEKSKMLNMESFLAKTKGLYQVEEVGRSVGLGRHLLYCRKLRIPEKQIQEIDFKECELIYDVGGMTQVFRKEDCVVKLNFKYDHYPGRWMRTHIVLHKEFPEIIPELYYTVMQDGNTKGKITEYLNSGIPNYRNLFKIQNYLINNLNLMMIDFHPNHVYGDHVVDLEAIDNIDTYCMGYLYRFVNETWKVGGGYEDPNINQQAVQGFVDNISNRAAYFAASMAGQVDKYTVIKNIKEIFKDAEGYTWSKNLK